MKKYLFIFVFSFLEISCIHKISAVEGNPSTAPYDSLGALEIQKRTPLACCWFYSPVKLLTFGILGDEDGTGKTKCYKNVLRSALAKKAMQYHPDAVIHVEYWPDPKGDVYPDGHAHARGEMIKYKKFPSEQS